MTSEPMPKPKRALSVALRMAVAVGLFVIVVTVGFALGLFVQSNPQWAVLSSAATDEEFERRVADYLVNNPEVIADAFELYSERQGGSSSLSQAPNPPSGHIRSAGLTKAQRERDLNEDPGSPVRGNANGDVTLVEFFDYNCPYCRELLTTLADLQEANPRLRIVYKEFPILSDNSR
ncbi:MAG: thioredoxin domain-containing protein, partial [Alphaproteobacteria bacterium]|nr:thioredoxin domain-containing protein [Alphaproteobacteria bacterium]